MYIAIEGIDTAGKSTQIALAATAFPEALVTKEPGGTPAGEAIRSIVLEGKLQSAKAEFLLFLADRAEHMQSRIKPNLHRMIVSDRSLVSGIAYALVKEEIDLETILAYNRFATEAINPDIVFLLKLTPEALHYRLSQKALDGIEARGETYLLQIQEALETAAHAIDTELVILDATASPDVISETIINHIKSRL